MMNLVEIIKSVDLFMGNYPLLIVFTIFFILKFYLLFHLTQKIYNSKYKIHISSFFLTCVLIASLIGESAWIIKLLSLLFFKVSYSRFYLFYIRLAWAFVLLQYQFLGLFLESLTEKKFYLSIKNKISVVISSILFCSYISFALYVINSYEKISNTDFIFQKTITTFGLIFIMINSIWTTSKKFKDHHLPRILIQQLKLLMVAIIAPYWLLDFLQVFPFDFSPTWITNSYTFVTLSNIFLSFAVYYCSKKVMRLRFLNLKNKVEAPINVNFMHHFKKVIEQFSQATSIHELGHITKSFFKEAIFIEPNYTSLYIRHIASAHMEQQETERKTYSLVETFMSSHEEAICNFIKKNKILSYDEIEFSHFYEPSNETKEVLNFLHIIKADIFIPIYHKDKLITFIIIDRFARIDQFYSDTEYDEMLIFARYLCNMITLLDNQNIEALIQDHNELKNELYRKHTEINQYKESIRSFLRLQKQKAIGIIFYKNRKFVYGNQAAHELLKININAQEGHHLVKALKLIVQQVISFKAPQTSCAKDAQGNMIVLSGVPSMEQQNVIISVYYPEISDILKQQIDMLKDPSEWDYLLYLETTKSGKLINQLIPATGENLLQFKITLLKTAMSKKATLLDAPDADLNSIVELLHHLSMRETLYTIDLQSPADVNEVGIKLFGINPIFGKVNNQQPIFQQLDKSGTLFIKNIHFLPVETQELVAEFIRYGYYRPFKSDHKIPADIRIIASSSQNLNFLIQKRAFSQELYEVLKQTAISLPSLITLPDEEIATLADGYGEQTIQTQTFKNLLSLTDKEKSKITENRPSSLAELRAKVQYLLVAKSKHNQIYHDTQFDPAYDIADPELSKAARLGKQALKDQKIMHFLWKKFENQNKIATFLGVNRSSINRRCKQYNIGLYASKEAEHDA